MNNALHRLIITPEWVMLPRSMRFAPQDKEEAIRFIELAGGEYVPDMSAYRFPKLDGIQRMKKYVTREIDIAREIMRLKGAQGGAVLGNKARDQKHYRKALPAARKKARAAHE